MNDWESSKDVFMKKNVSLSNGIKKENKSLSEIYLHSNRQAALIFQERMGGGVI